MLLRSSIIVDDRGIFFKNQCCCFALFNIEYMIAAYAKVCKNNIVIAYNLVWRGGQCNGTSTKLIDSTFNDKIVIIGG